MLSVHVMRDDVAAGDEVRPYSFEMEGSASLRSLFQFIAGQRYLASVSGTKHSWQAKINGNVVAEFIANNCEPSDSDLLEMPIETWAVNGVIKLFFGYESGSHLIRNDSGSGRNNARSGAPTFGQGAGLMNRPKMSWLPWKWQFRKNRQVKDQLAILEEIKAGYTQHWALFDHLDTTLSIGLTPQDFGIPYLELSSDGKMALIAAHRGKEISRRETYEVNQLFRWLFQDQTARDRIR